MNLFDITGHAIVVTGGAGYLGRHFCAALANAGAMVLCLSSKEGDFSELREGYGIGSIKSVICDVEDQKSFEAEIKAFAAEHGRLDALVNNAMRAPRGIDIDMPAEEFTSALRTILTQYFACAQSFLRHCSEPASIVNIASMWGFVSPDPKMYLDLRNEPCLAMPSAAAGILQLGKYLAMITAQRGVRVNALVPGCFPKKRGPDRPDYMAEIESRVPMGRIGQPHELTGGLIYLVSQASSYVTGGSLVIDGGYTAK